MDNAEVPKTMAAEPYSGVVNVQVLYHLPGGAAVLLPMAKTDDKTQNLTETVCTQGPDHTENIMEGPDHTENSMEGPDHTENSTQGPNHTESSTQGPDHTENSTQGPDHTENSMQGPNHTENSTQGPNHTELFKTDNRLRNFADWKFKHYFEFVEILDAKNIMVKCKLCGGQTTLVTSTSTNARLMRHLIKQHGTIKLVAKDPWVSDSTGSGPDGATPSIASTQGPDHTEVSKTDNSTPKLTETKRSSSKGRWSKPCGGVDVSQHPALQTWLPPGYDYHVCSIEEKPTEFDHSALYATVRLPLNTAEELNEWVLKTRCTPVTWRVKSSRVAAGHRVLYRMDYKCQHHVNLRSTTASSRKTCKNTGCPAKLSVLLKCDTGGIRSIKDSHLPQYPAEIILANTHNHNLYEADALKHRDVGPKAIQSLTRLLQTGHTPSSALAAFQKELKAEYGDKYIFAAADRAICPDLNFCQRLSKMMVGRVGRQASSRPESQSKRKKKKVCPDVLQCVTPAEEQTDNSVRGQSSQQKQPAPCASQGDPQTNQEEWEAADFLADLMQGQSSWQKQSTCASQGVPQTNQEDVEVESSADFLCLSAPSDHGEDSVDLVKSMIRDIDSMTKDPNYSLAIAAMAKQFHQIKSNPSRMLSVYGKDLQKKSTSRRTASVRRATRRLNSSASSRADAKRGTKRRLPSGRPQTHGSPVDRQQMIEYHKLAFSVENNESVKRQRMIEYHKLAFSLQRNGSNSV